MFQTGLNESKIWIIAGPTASGKSSLALQLAQHYKGEILNADSIQTYRDLHILTARPSLEDEQIVPHHGYGCLDATESFSTGAWRRWVHVQINRLQNQGKPIFITGGTGLYLRSITHPFVDIPDIDPAVRLKITDEIIQCGLDQSYRRLQYVDPVIANKISPSDPQRIIRALEVFHATGTPLSIWQSQHCQPAQYNFTTILLQPSKEQLHLKAHRRIDQMLIDGAVDEVKNLIERQIPLSAPIFRALGARELWKYLHQQLSLEQVTLLIQQSTRQYIKRQYTWFRHQFQADHVLQNEPQYLDFLQSLSIEPAKN